MPLSRYEIRSEYSLANPDLYRVADKDDPEGLLEGVAMAGLVGIIRQLGDLAEFAAEVFHDLHEDILVIASRGHELLMRVRQLETEVPLIEDLMLTKSDDVDYYNPGLEWHTHIHNDQNHFTQGDLPRFIRSAYEDCRSPPRLFVLDRFDVAGSGACLKRFTDPSFFKMEWASSELMKAEKEQRDQKARRMKKKGRQKRNGEVGEARPTSHIELREQIEVEDTASLSISSSSSDFSLGFDQEALDLLTRESSAMLSASALFSPEPSEGPQSKAMPAKDLSVKELASESSSSKTELSTLETLVHMDVDGLKEDIEIGLGESDLVADDSASETDNFMDAVTTMDSEVETDSEMKARVEGDGESLTESEEVESPVPLDLPISEHPRGEDEEHVVIEEDKEHFIIKQDKEYLIIDENKEGFVMEEESSSGDHMSEESLRTEQALGIGNAPNVVVEEENSCFVQDNDASTPNSFSGTGLQEDCVAKSKEEGVAKLEEDGVAKLEEDGAAKSGEYSVDKVPTGFAKELDSSFANKSDVATSIQDSDVSTSISQIVASSPCIGDAVSNLEDCLHSESINIVLETPEISETDNKDNFFLVERLPADFNHLPDLLGKDPPLNESPKALGALNTRKRWQISKLFHKESLASDLNRNGLQASENEQSESPKKLSPHSSPSSSIQPMIWAMRSYNTDDEMDGMQISSASPSSSSSTVSTPRPSTLATTLRKMGLEVKTQSPLFPQKSAGSSPRSLVSSPSGINTAPYQPLVKTTAEPVISPASECSTHSSPQSSSSSVQRFFDSLPSSGLAVNTSNAENLAEQFSAQSLSVNNLDIFPPPPPLPPLAWHTTRSHSNLVYPSKPRDSDRSSCDVGVLPDELSQGFTSSSTVPTVPHTSVVKPNGLTQACDSLSKVQPAAQKFEVMPDKSLQSFTLAAGTSDLPTLHGSCELPQVSEPAGSHKRASISVTSNADTVEKATVSDLEPSDLKGEDLVTVQPDRNSQEKLNVGNTRVFPSRVLPTESTPARLDDSSLGLQTKAAGEYGSSPLQRPDSPSTKFERGDFFVEATTSRDMNRLKKRSKWALTSSTASSDDREVLLEQIRTRSFNLRHTSTEKLTAPRPVTNINVAAILEKANAIRQAFAGSDEDEEDDEWSDA